MAAAMFTPPALKLVWDSILELGKHQRLARAVEGNVKGSLVAGSSALAGGLIFGPVGMALGGLLGGYFGATRYKAESVVGILLELDADEKEELIRKLFESVQGCTSLEQLSRMLVSSSQVQTIAINLIKEVVENRGQQLQ